MKWPNEIPCPLCGEDIEAEIYQEWLWEEGNEFSFQCPCCHRRVEVEVDLEVGGGVGCRINQEVT